MANLQGWHLLVILLVILLLFGAAKLPALAKSMGQSARAFKKEIKEMKEEDAASAPSPTLVEGVVEASEQTTTENKRPTT